MLGPAPWDGVMADPVEKRSCPMCITVPNSVALGQTISAHMGSHKFLDVGSRTTWNVGVSDPLAICCDPICFRCQLNSLGIL